MTEAEVEVVAPGKVFLTHGWGEIARVCRIGSALVIHLEYDGASLMFFKVFDEEGRRLECCPQGRRLGHQSGEDQAGQLDALWAVLQLAWEHPEADTAVVEQLSLLP